jgi:hypothetical protein
MHNKSIKIGCQCDFRVGRAMSNLTLEFYTIITSMEHVDSQGSPYHRCCATIFKGMCLEHAPQLK